MKRPLLFIVILILIAVIVGVGKTWLWPQVHSKENGSLTLCGNIEIRDARLVFNEEEILEQVMVEEGDTIASGQILARLRSVRMQDQLTAARANLEAQRQVVQRLKTGTRRQEIEQARSEVEAARVRANNARLNLERLQKTVPVGASSKQTLDNAKARLDDEEAQLKVRRQALDLALEGPRREDIGEAEARLQAKEAEISLLLHRLEDTILKSPSDGIIQSRILEPGEMAGPSRPVFILALTNPKWVRAYVPEPDLGRLVQGAVAAVTSDSRPDRSFNGQVGFISPVAEFTPKTVETTDLRTKLVYEVRILVHDPDNQLKLGMPVTVEIAQLISPRSVTD
ncbi:MAG: efflux RND transporter periplasmic adaptor subunit [Pseudomonadota bacterium]